MYVTVNSSKDLRRTQNEEKVGHSVLLLRTLRAPCLGAPGQLIAGGQEHGRTIPLAEVAL